MLTVGMVGRGGHPAPTSSSTPALLYYNELVCVILRSALVRQDCLTSAPNSRVGSIADISLTGLDAPTPFLKDDNEMAGTTAEGQAGHHSHANAGEYDQEPPANQSRGHGCGQCSVGWHRLRHAFWRDSRRQLSNSGKHVSPCSHMHLAADQPRSSIGHRPNSTCRVL